MNTSVLLWRNQYKIHKI